MTIEHKSRKTAKKHNKPTVHSNDNNSVKKPIIIGLAYSNGCGYCNAMRPDWETMKERVNADNKLNSMVEFVEMEKGEADADEKLAKINADLVECEPIVINGYPTMFCKKEHYAKQYDGDRSAEALTQWVRNAALNGQLGGKKRNVRSSSNKKIKKIVKRSKKSKKSLVSFLKFW
jgi:hypothetical protein